jgi:hypothetical protein
VRQELIEMKPDIDFGYLDMAIDILKKKKIEGGQASSIFNEIDEGITVIIENSVWDTLPADFQHVIDYPESSVLGVQFYLTKIFEEGKISSAALKLFLKFFPNEIKLFYACLSKRCSDIEFTEGILSNLKILDHDMLLDILEQIYSLSHNYIKLEVLRIMNDLDRYHKEYLMDILSKEIIPLRKEALLILMKDKKTRDEILSSFFSVDDPWNINTKVLLFNLALIEDLGIKDVKDYLINLNKKVFFWNWNLKRRIREVLNKWK